jgi:hypothetical protein
MSRCRPGRVAVEGAEVAGEVLCLPRGGGGGVGVGVRGAADLGSCIRQLETPVEPPCFGQRNGDHAARLEGDGHPRGLEGLRVQDDVEDAADVLARCIHHLASRAQDRVDLRHGDHGVLAVGRVVPAPNLWRACRSPTRNGEPGSRLPEVVPMEARTECSQEDR